MPMQRIFDTHAHYFDKKFDTVEGGADAVLESVFANDVAGIVNVGTNLQNAHTVIEQASRYPQMYAATSSPTPKQLLRSFPCCSKIKKKEKPIRLLHSVK